MRLEPAKPSTGAAPAQAPNTRSLPPPLTSPDREERAHTALKNTAISPNFKGLPLAEAVQQFSDSVDLPIRIDEAALKAAQVPVDSPITFHVVGGSFQDILNRCLIPRGLDWYIEEPGLVVTTPSGSRQRLDETLNYEIRIIDYLCELSDAQSRKLKLAGQNDIEQLLNAIQKLRVKMQTAPEGRGIADGTARKLATAGAEPSPFGQQVESGAFGKGSLFRKTLETLLTPEQMVKYEPIQEVVQAGGSVATLQRGPDVLLSVRLWESPITDDGLSCLKALPRLGFLDLNATKITDAGVAHLEDLTTLRELALGGTQITDVALPHLKKLVRLETLDITGRRVTDASLETLRT